MGVSEPGNYMLENKKSYINSAIVKGCFWILFYTFFWFKADSWEDIADK
jgi:hypothetical protein